MAAGRRPVGDGVCRMPNKAVKPTLVPRAAYSCHWAWTWAARRASKAWQRVWTAPDASCGAKGETRPVHPDPCGMGLRRRAQNEHCSPRFPCAPASRRCHQSRKSGACTHMDSDCAIPKNLAKICATEPRRLGHTELARRAGHAEMAKVSANPQTILPPNDT